MEIHNHLDLLGHKCRDRVTGMTGVITSISFDLYGCVQAIVNPGSDEKGDLREVHWFDVPRLEITSKTPVMERPNFVSGYVAAGKKGPAEKPVMNKA